MLDSIRRLTFKVKNNIPDTETVSYQTIKFNGKRYRIPVGADGYVPMLAIVERFQKLGDPDDVGRGADRILPKRLTPEQIVEWWADPSSCDIKGIDDDRSEVYDVENVPPSKRAAQKRIAVLADQDEQRRIREILSESFSAEELEAMSKNGAFIIRSVESCGNATGCYYRKQNGVEIPLIVIEYKVSPDGLVHEVVHHSRATDQNRKGILATTFPTDKDGKLNLTKYLKLPKWKREEILEEEERQTTAETLVRTKKDRMQSGYYDYVPDTDPRDAYIEDRDILTGGKRKKGKAARYAVLNNYAYTNIAKAEILNRNMAKKR